MSTLRQAFDRFDRDGSGEIEVDELDELLGSLGLDASSDNVLIALAKLQTENPSCVTWSELSAWWRVVEADVAGGWATPKLRALFDKFDADGNGSIQVSELEALLAAAGAPVEREAVFAAVQAHDLNHDGVMSFDEFVAWWSTLELD